MRGKHQAGVKEAAERRAAVCHLGERREDDGVHHGILERRREGRRRRVGAHAAGVRSGLTLADALVVLRGAERQRGGAVAEGEQRNLLALQAFLDHHRGAGIAVHAGIHHRVDGGKRLIVGGGDNDGFAGGEAVRLHHQRRATAADEFARGFGIVEAFPLRGGDACGIAQFLGEGLAAFQLRGLAGRANARDRCGFHGVGDASDQRGLGAGDDEVDLVVLRKRDQCGKSITPIGTHSATWAMPGLPGAHQSFVSSGLAAIAQHSACSRPPDPITRTRMQGSCQFGATPMRAVA